MESASLSQGDVTVELKFDKHRFFGSVQTKTPETAGLRFRVTALSSQVVSDGIVYPIDRNQEFQLNSLSEESRQNEPIRLTIAESEIVRNHSDVLIGQDVERIASAELVLELLVKDADTIEEVGSSLDLQLTKQTLIGESKLSLLNLAKGYTRIDLKCVIRV